MNNIVIISIVIVIIVIIGAIILNSSSSDSTTQPPSSGGSTTTQPPSSGGSTTTQPPSSNTTTTQPPSSNTTTTQPPSSNTTTTQPPSETVEPPSETVEPPSETVEPPSSIVEYTYCPALSEEYPRTLAGETVEVVCPVGKRTRICNVDGTWSDEDISKCYCPAIDDWPETTVGEIAEINCNSGKRTRICNVDGTWSDEDNDYCSDIVCTNIPKDIPDGKTLITIHVQYSFEYKFCMNINKYVNEKIGGTYDFTFTANTNSITKEYDNVKNNIPAAVFAHIKPQVDNINSKYECKIEQNDISYYYPSKLHVFKTEQYLIIVGNHHFVEIETYSNDYPYNYINNSTVTLQSKNLQIIRQTNNVLYKIWTHVRDWASEATCNNTGLSYVLGHTITPVYTNKYVTFCLILIAMLRDANITLSSLGDCKVTFRFPHSKRAAFMLSEKPYCQGIYTVSDMKNSIVNLCKVINSWSGKGWTYTIDLNAAYQSTPTVYNIASKKTIPVFNTGSNLVSDERYNRIVNSQNPNIPSLHCNIYE